MYTTTAEVVVYTVQKCFTQKVPYSSARVFRGRIGTQEPPLRRGGFHVSMCLPFEKGFCLLTCDSSRRHSKTRPPLGITING